MSRIVTFYNLDDVNPLTKKVMNGVEPDGWYPVDIEYSFNLIQSDVEYLVWKISGTDHVFKIQSDILEKIHKDNLRDHFLKTLERFAHHYKNYKELGYADDWKAEYTKKFGDRIIS
jgi:hypothetical protein